MYNKGDIECLEGAISVKSIYFTSHLFVLEAVIVALRGGLHIFEIAIRVLEAVCDNLEVVVTL